MHLGKELWISQLISSTKFCILTSSKRWLHADCKASRTSFHHSYYAKRKWAISDCPKRYISASLTAMIFFHCLHFLSQRLHWASTTLQIQTAPRGNREHIHVLRQNESNGQLRQRKHLPGHTLASPAPPPPPDSFFTETCAKCFENVQSTFPVEKKFKSRLSH